MTATLAGMAARPGIGRVAGAVRRIAASDMDWSGGARALWDEPLCIEGGAADWPIAEQLTFRRLGADFGDLKVRPARTRDPSIRGSTSLRAYLRYASSTADRDPWYLSLRVAELDTQLYRLIPRPGALASWVDLLPAEIRPEMTWVFVGPPRSGTPRHQDILGTSAWNALFAGVKRWTFEPPERRRSAKGPASVTCVQRPGDLMYTPSTWFHTVANEKPAIALTGNYLNETNVKRAIVWLRAEGRHEWIRVLRHLEKESRRPLKRVR